MAAYVPDSSNHWDYYGDDDNGAYQSGRGGKANRQYAEQVVRIVNQNRAKKGLDELEIDDGLMESAQIRAEELTRSYSHTRPDGSDGWEMAWDSVSLDDGAGHAVGENIAYGQKSADAVMTAWMNSAGHHKNIMNKTYTMIGVGCYEKNGTLYWAQLFAG